MTADARQIDLQRAATVIRQGGLVAIPTETVYGLAANALDPQAVARIFAAKDRPFFDPLIVHIADTAWWPRVVREFPPLAERLAERFWPGPLTLVLPKSAAIPDLVTSGLPTVGIRLPDHPLTRELILLADVPVAAPSANPFGRLSPTTADHVRRQLGDRVDMVLDGGPCRVGVESTILQIQDNQALLLRPGGVSLEEIEAEIGSVSLLEQASQDKPAAPGMLDSHYAPRTKLQIVDKAPVVPPASLQAGLLTLTPQDTSRFAAAEVLSKTGDLIEAAANFFQALHRLDQLGLDLILATPFPTEGLGRALNDRLRRAAHS